MGNAIQGYIGYFLKITEDMSMSLTERIETKLSFKDEMLGKPIVTLQWRYSLHANNQPDVVTLTKSHFVDNSAGVVPSGFKIQDLPLHYSFLSFKHEQFAAERKLASESDDFFLEGALLSCLGIFKDYDKIYMASEIGQKAEVYLKTGNGDLFMGIAPDILTLGGMERDYLFTLATLYLTDVEFEELSQQGGLPENLPFMRTEEGDLDWGDTYEYWQESPVEARRTLTAFLLSILRMRAEKLENPIDNDFDIFA